MTKKLDSDALGDVNRALGLTGAGSPVTELNDGIVDQVLEVNQLARRGRTAAASSGIFTAIIQNEHAMAGMLSTQLDPFAVGSTARIAPYPDPLPLQFDLWLLSAGLRRTAGAGTVIAALFYQYSAQQQGWGINDSGAQIIESPPYPMISWDTMIAVNTTAGRTAGVSNVGPGKIGVRLPRPPGASLASLRFVSTPTEAATYQCQIVLGVFPIGLGQDGIV